MDRPGRGQSGSEEQGPAGEQDRDAEVEADPRRSDREGVIESAPSARG
jgi:hypothetical protein